MSHRCFISFKKEDARYKDLIALALKDEDVIVRSLDKWIDSENENYIMQVIRRDYLLNSTVTIFLIGEHSSENEGLDGEGRDKNYFIKRELRASLYAGEEGNSRNGLLGVVLPSMVGRVFGEFHDCEKCGGRHRYINVTDAEVIREFGRNYFIKPHDKCYWAEEDRYAVLVPYNEFMEKDAEGTYVNMDKYIEKAFNKRDASVAARVTVRPDGKYS